MSFLELKSPCVGDIESKQSSEQTKRSNLEKSFQEVAPAEDREARRSTPPLYLAFLSRF